MGGTVSMRVTDCRLSIILIDGRIDGNLITLNRGYIMLDCILKEARKQSQMINDAYKLAMSENYSDWMQASYLFDTIKNNERSRENN